MGNQCGGTCHNKSIVFISEYLQIDHFPKWENHIDLQIDTFPLFFYVGK